MTDVLRALSDPTRILVLELVREGPVSVGEIAARVPVSRPAVSQHLRLLLDAGLVRFTRDGTRHVYAVDPTGVATIRAWLDRFSEIVPVGETHPTQGAPGSPTRPPDVSVKEKRSKKKRRGKKKRRRDA